MEDQTVISKLSSACQTGSLISVRSLLDQGADVNAQGSDGMAPVHFLCSYEDNPVSRLQILEEFYSHGLVINIKNQFNETPLLLACKNNLVGLAESLIAAGCDVNIADKGGNTPFTEVCERASEGWYFWSTEKMDNDEFEEDNLLLGQSDEPDQEDSFPPALICKMLLRAGASPTQATLLPSAVLFSTQKVVREFLDLGMDVNATDKNGRAPLLCACCAHIPTSMVRLLLERGAKANGDKGSGKNKPITSAYVHNSVDKIRLLLSYGATVSCEEMSELVNLGLSKYFLENPEVITEDSSDLQAWKLLLKAGFRPKLQSLKLSNISLCSSYPQISPWINKLLFPNPLLQDCCRVTIRSHVRVSIDHHVDQLNIPNQLKNFLKFNNS